MVSAGIAQLARAEDAADPTRPTSPTSVTGTMRDAGADKSIGKSNDDEGIPIAGQKTTTLFVEPRIGRPIEREPEFLAKAPGYHRAIEMDRDQRWAEAAGLYQQALIEIGTAVRLAPTALLEQAAFKTDLERRRSRTLAQALGGDSEGWPPLAPPLSRAASPPIATPPSAAHPAPPATPPPIATRPPLAHTLPQPHPSPRTMRPTSAQPRLPALERARLLRQKLMAVRSATGSVPGGLLSATLAALGQALRKSDASDGGAHDTGKLPARGGDPEVRLLLCATRAVAGDRAGARIERAHVSQSDRLDPARALAVATCEAALGYNDQALATLAVVVHRLGPSSRFLPGQTRELQSANDWDALRNDSRFERLFR